MKWTTTATVAALLVVARAVQRADVSRKSVARPARAAAPLGEFVGAGSCNGLCGGSSGSCYCDALCTDYRDCCSDFEQTCCYDPQAHVVTGGACPHTCAVEYHASPPAIPSGHFLGSTLKIWAAPDCGTTGYPAATHDGVVYYALSFYDNRMATYLAGYDVASGAFLGGYTIAGVRYACALSCEGSFLTVTGQGRLTGSIPLSSLQLTTAAHDGVLAYPAEEARITQSCFANDDEFACGWYCAQAMYVEASTDGGVTLTPFGEGNEADQARCSDCSLFQGSGFVANGDLTAPGAVAKGFLNGGYKWQATYDAAAAEVFVNYTDYKKPCAIRYVVTAGQVMGVPPAPGRPAKPDSDAVLSLVGTAPPVGKPEYAHLCATTLPGCRTWNVRMAGDVADWQNQDDNQNPALQCPSRVHVWSIQHGKYTGHDGIPRGSDSKADGGRAKATRNTVVSFGPPPVAPRCEQYFAVVDGCFDGVGPKCGAQHMAATTMERVRAQVAAVRARRAARQARLGGRAQARGQPVYAADGAAGAAASLLAAQGAEFADAGEPGWLSFGSLAGVAATAAVVAVVGVSRLRLRKSVEYVPVEDATPLLRTSTV